MTTKAKKKKQKNPKANGTVSLPVCVEEHQVDHHHPWPVTVGLLTGNNFMPLYEAGATNVADAKRDVAHTLTQALMEKQAADRNNRRVAIGTGSGAVLLVEWSYGAWGYAITGSGRPNASGCSFSPATTFSGVLENAQRHANDMGGVAWETRY